MMEPTNNMMITPFISSFIRKWSLNEGILTHMKAPKAKEENKIRRSIDDSIGNCLRICSPLDKLFLLLFLLAIIYRSVEMKGA